MIRSFLSPDAFLDASCPIDWSHPINYGLIGCWMVPPLSGWRGGLSSRDLVRGGRKATDGVLTAGPTWIGSQGRKGGYGGLSFKAASSQFVTVDAASVIAAGNAKIISICFWMKTTDASTNPYTVSCSAHLDDQPYLALLHLGASSGVVDSAWRTQTASADVTGTTVVNDGKWWWVCTTSDGTTITTYVNGKSEGTPGSVPGGTYGLTNFQFGYFNRPTLGHYYDGQLDDVRVYNRGLTTAEVMQVYQQSRRGHPDTLRWVSTVDWSFPTAGGGPTTYTQNLSLNASATTSMIRQVGKFPSLSVSMTKVLLRQVGKTLSDSVSSASQMIRQQGKTLSANASNTPTITKQTTRSLSVDESSSSTLGKQISKTLVDSISSSSTITRQAAKGINLSASSTSNIDTQVGHSLTVNADHTTALTKQVGKPLSVLESQSSSLTRQVAKTLSLSVSVNNVLVATKAFLQSLNVNVSSTSQMVRQVGKTLSLGVVVVTSVVKLISHALSLTASGLVSLTKQVGKPLAFIVQAQPTQTQVKARSQNLSVDVASSSTLTKLVSKSFSVTCSVSTFLFKQTAKTLSVGVSSVKSLFKGIGKLLGLSTASTSTLNTQVTSGDVTPGTLSAVRHIITVDLSITPATGAFPPFRQDFYRTDYSSGSPVSTLIHSGPELTFIDTQLQPNTLYGYQVRVFDNTGASNSSNFVQVTTLPITTKEKITWSGSTAIRINWEGKTTIKITWD